MGQLEIALNAKLFDVLLSYNNPTFRPIEMKSLACQDLQTSLIIKDKNKWTIYIERLACSELNIFIILSYTLNFYRICFVK